MRQSSSNVHSSSRSGNEKTSFKSQEANLQSSDQRRKDIATPSLSSHNKTASISRSQLEERRAGSISASRSGSNSVQDGRTSSSGAATPLAVLGNELIDKLKEKRRQMADNGDAVPSLADMLQDLLDQLHGKNTTSSSSSSSTTKPNSAERREGGFNRDSSSRETKQPLGPPSSSLQRKSESVRHNSSKPSPSSSSTRPAESSSRPTGTSSRLTSYVAVNETVLDCKGDGSGSSDQRMDRRDERPLAAKKQPTKSTWDQIYERVQQNKPKSTVSERRPQKRPAVKDVLSDDEEDDDIDDLEEEEDEDDDDMRGFIDDGSDEDDQCDYSHYIRELFGYDRRKFRDEPKGDLRDMESSFSRVMQEETISAKLGLLEDLEDIKREEEEKREKLAKTKGKKQRLK
jgi:protein SPT2